jgi:8-oxo-dGTP diphosphatase
MGLNQIFCYYLGMDNTPCTYRISAKAVIKDDDDRILLLRDSRGNWEFPGGGIEHGEDPKTALVRELDEETGFKVDWISDNPIAFWTIEREAAFPNGLKFFAFVVYEVKASGEFKPEVPGTKENQEAKYFTIEETSGIQLHKNTQPYFS